MKNIVRGPLTEPMFYVLMAFLKQDMCGIDITEYVNRRTGGRVQLGPGTLYTILAKFQEDGLIEEVAVDGRKRTYRLTGKGRETYMEELERLQKCLQDGEAALR
ncbi:MAG: PadR family transcriptional regulator [Oscillospiraceae bacterium]